MNEKNYKIISVGEHSSKMPLSAIKKCIAAASAAMVFAAGVIFCGAAGTADIASADCGNTMEMNCETDYIPDEYGIPCEADKPAAAKTAGEFSERAAAAFKNALAFVNPDNTEIVSIETEAGCEEENTENAGCDEYNTAEAEINTYNYAAGGGGQEESGTSSVLDSETEANEDNYADEYTETDEDLSAGNSEEDMIDEIYGDDEAPEGSFVSYEEDIPEEMPAETENEDEDIPEDITMDDEEYPEEDIYGGGKSSHLKVPEWLALDEEGLPIEYMDVLKGKSCAYTAEPDALMSTGKEVFQGYVAVDPDLIPYGSELYIIAEDGEVYGYAIAADTGYSVREGHIIVDLFMNEYDDCIEWGAKQVSIYVLRYAEEDED